MKKELYFLLIQLKKGELDYYQPNSDKCQMIASNFQNHVQYWKSSNVNTAKDRLNVAAGDP